MSMADTITTESTPTDFTGTASTVAEPPAAEPFTPLKAAEGSVRLDDLVHRIAWPAAGSAKQDELLSREWLVTNGLGGYASGSVAGAITRRYHALLIAALPAPLGRVVMLNHLSERLRFADKSVVWLGAHNQGGRLAQIEGAQHLVEFRLEGGLPVWRYQVGAAIIEKSLVMVHGQNTVHVRYTLVAPPLSKDGQPAPVRLGLRPLINFRPHDSPVTHAVTADYRVTASSGRIEVCGPNEIPALRLAIHGGDAAFTLDSHAVNDVKYEYEAQRGYEHEGPLWSPGYFRANLAPGASVALVASVESWDVIGAVPPESSWIAERERRSRLLVRSQPQARQGPAAELVLAADQFIITPAGRTEDSARAHAVGDEVRTVIAGYFWFTDWGRDTMISLDGLTLVTGRHREAGYILRTFAQYVRDGLIPNLFPERDHEGLYHTADATLWFFHALDRYLTVTGDRGTLDQLRPTLRDIIDWHLRGTHFNIHVDPQDGLLAQGAAGYQLTWMDAKVGDWVVTPRRGKAVEINALWYNALCLLEGWMREPGGSGIPADAYADQLAAHAAQARESFNRRFWNEATGYLFDVVDGEDGGDDPACRPNQVLAMALRHKVLDRSRWAPVLEVVREKLLTPVGLRSLSPDHPDYKPLYFGDLRARDAAYHQGTVWAWLIGPFVDAWLAQHPGDFERARGFLHGFVHHLDDACIGSISEVFDAQAPFTPRGCIAQAWSVAEVLRAWVNTTT
jgi:predicted glycogen debranching enzyme